MKVICRNCCRGKKMKPLKKQIISEKFLYGFKPFEIRPFRGRQRGPGPIPRVDLPDVRGGEGGALPLLHQRREPPEQYPAARRGGEGMGAVRGLSEWFGKASFGQGGRQHKEGYVGLAVTPQKAPSTGRGRTTGKEGRGIVRRSRVGLERGIQWALERQRTGRDGAARSVWGVPGAGGWHRGS